MNVTPLGYASNDQLVFAKVADNLYRSGYSVIPNGLPLALAERLFLTANTIDESQFVKASIGREQTQRRNRFVRSDEICWITGSSFAGQSWLQWCESLRQYLNRHLFLGLFSFETHFAHYRPGDFYKTHRDAFKGQQNRRVSIVGYLNPGWEPSDGGQLVIYDDHMNELQKVTPSFATLVVFLSEDFPHQVLPANRDRYSVAGWFRINTSSGDSIDPPN